MIARALANDIWSKYGSHASFGGWYLPFEVDNCQLQTSADVNTFVDHFLGPLTKTLNNLNSSKADIHVSRVRHDSRGWMWLSVRVGNRVAVDPAENEEQYLHKWVSERSSVAGRSRRLVEPDLGARVRYSSLKNTIAAAQLPHPISLWANTEVYYNPNAANPMSLNLVVADMRAVQPDVAAYTSFTWAEFYNPQFVNPAYGVEKTHFYSVNAICGFVLAPVSPKERTSDRLT